MQQLSKRIYCKSFFKPALLIFTKDSITLTLDTPQTNNTINHTVLPETVCSNTAPSDDTLVITGVNAQSVVRNSSASSFGAVRLSAASEQAFTTGPDRTNANSKAAADISRHSASICPRMLLFFIPMEYRIPISCLRPCTQNIKIRYRINPSPPRPTVSNNMAKKRIWRYGFASAR